MRSLEGGPHLPARPVSLIGRPLWQEEGGGRGQELLGHHGRRDYRPLCRGEVSMTISVPQIWKRPLQYLPTLGDLRLLPPRLADLQLTIIVRDITEDRRDGHVYLPQDEPAAFGLMEDELTGGQVSEPRRSLRFQPARHRRLYAEA
jgi:hypothetical protein